MSQEELARLYKIVVAYGNAEFERGVLYQFGISGNSVTLDKADKKAVDCNLAIMLEFQKLIGKDGLTSIQEERFFSWRFGEARYVIESGDVSEWAVAVWFDVTGMLWASEQIVKPTSMTFDVTAGRLTRLGLVPEIMRPHWRDSLIEIVP